MQQVAIIGLSSFGTYLAKALTMHGSSVLVVDSNKGIIDDIKAHVTKAIIADATDRRIIKELNLVEMDEVIISLGSNLESSILVALHLTEAGIINITAKATSEDHAKILEKIGVKKIIFPERDMGLRLAQSLAKRSIIDYMPLGEEFSIIEIFPSEEMIGKSLIELNFREKYKSQVIAIKTNDKKEHTDIPLPHTKIAKNQTLIILGRNEDLEFMKK